MPTSAKLAAVLTLIAGLGAGCASRPAADHFRPAETTTSAPLQGRPELAMPIPVAGRDVCFVPLTMEDTKGWFEDKDPYTRGGTRTVAFDRAMPGVAYTHQGGAVRWHNVLFRDLSTKEQWALLDARGVISEWWPLGPRNERGQLTRADLLVFIVTRRDSNGDGLLNDLDERIAVVTDGRGRGAREVTPPGAQVWHTMHDPDRLATYFLVVADTNADGKVDHADEAAPYLLTTNSADPAEPVIDPALAARTTRLLR